MLANRFKHMDGSQHIDGIGVHRPLVGSPDKRLCGKMEHNIRVSRFHGGLQAGFIPDISGNRSH
ncbi:hypothetical protein D3C73_1559980 [compost metagenome]